MPSTSEKRVLMFFSSWMSSVFEKKRLMKLSFFCGPLGFEA